MIKTQKNQHDNGPDMLYLHDHYYLGEEKYAALYQHPKRYGLLVKIMKPKQKYVASIHTEDSVVVETPESVHVVQTCGSSLLSRFLVHSLPFISIKIMHISYIFLSFIIFSKWLLKFERWVGGFRKISLQHQNRK